MHAASFLKGGEDFPENYTSKKKNIYIYKIKIKKTKEKKRNTHTHNSAKLQNSNPLRRRRGEKTTARAVDFPACVASHSFIHSFFLLL